MTAENTPLAERNCPVLSPFIRGANEVTPLKNIDYFVVLASNLRSIGA